MTATVKFPHIPALHGFPRRGDVGPGYGPDCQAPANSRGGVMAADHDQFDIDAIRIDPTDPTLVPRRGEAKARKKKWERKYHLLSVVVAGPA